MKEFRELGISGEGFSELGGRLEGPSAAEFIEQFREVASCGEAKDNAGIVYIWYTEAQIQRLKGTSNIIYIGQTKNSFYTRHYRYAAVEGSLSNWERYEHIIKTFGPIRVAIKVVSEPREREAELIRKYFEQHLELPPVNASG